MPGEAPDFPQLIEAWLARGAAHREATGAKVDLPYGEGEREKLDLFSGGDSNAPVLVYIHGGYWQRGDKNMYSFVSESFIKHGVTVAVLNYNLPRRYAWVRFLRRFEKRLHSCGARPAIWVIHATRCLSWVIRPVVISPR